MAQFDVFPHPVEEMRPSHPYVVQIQSGFLHRPIAVITVPLARLVPGSNAVAVLNPRFEVAGETLVLETLGLGSFEPSELRRPVVNLRNDADAIWSALDCALHGYSKIKFCNEGPNDVSVFMSVNPVAMAGFSFV